MEIPKMLKIKCACGHQFLVFEDAGFKEIKCPECGSIIKRNNYGKFSKQNTAAGE
jgi:ribosomal protein S27E